MSKPYVYKPGDDPYHHNHHIDISGSSGIAKTQNSEPTSTNASAKLVYIPTNQYLYLWIDEFSVDFSISGSTAQSRHYRQFFSHSFNQPQFVITGRVSNDFQYNRLAEFVRRSQLGALKTGEAPLRIQLPETISTHGKRRHRGWQMQGYVSTMAAGATVHNTAPTFELTFILSYSAKHGNVGIFEDGQTAVKAQQIVDWMSIITDAQGGKSNTVIVAFDKSFNTKAASSNSDQASKLQDEIDKDTYENVIKQFHS